MQLNSARRSVLELLIKHKGIAFANDVGYPATLRRMSDAGLITIQMASGGRRQNVVIITEIGRQAIRDDIEIRAAMNPW